MAGGSQSLFNRMELGAGGSQEIQTSLYTDPTRGEAWDVV